MKKLLHTLLMSWLALTLIAQDFDWAKAFGTNNSSNSSVVVDHLTRNPNNGWVFSAGSFRSGIILTADNPQISAISTSPAPAYIAAIDSQAFLVRWFGKFEGTGSINIYGIHYAANDRLWVVGDFSGAINFNIMGGTQNLNGNANRSGFIAAYNPQNGSLLFVQKFDIPTGTSGINICRVAAITSNSTGADVYFTGNFTGTINFNPLGTANNQTSVIENAFLMRYNVSGNSFTFKRWGGSSGNNRADGTAIAYTANNFVVAGGTFEGTVDFDPDAGVVNKTSRGGRDIFITRFSSTLAYSDNLVAGGTSEDLLRSLAPAGNFVYGGGSYSSKFYFNRAVGASLDSVAHTALQDALLLRVNTGGNFTFNPNWVLGIKGTGNQQINCVSADPDGNAYVSIFNTGEISGSEIGNNTLPTAGASDGIIAKYSTNGTNQFARRLFTAANDESRAIAAHGNNRFYVGGTFLGMLTIEHGSGSSTLSNTPSNKQNGYLVKYGITPCSAPPQPGPIQIPDTVCAGEQYIVSIQQVSGATSYEWTMPAGWSFTPVTNPVHTINVTVGSTGGIIRVDALNGACISPQRTKNVAVITQPAQPATINADKPTCFGDTVNFSIAAAAGATSYNWTVPGGWTVTGITNGGLNCRVVVGSTSGNVEVRANNFCGQSARSIAVTPLYSPMLPDSINGPSNVCSGDTVQYTVIPLQGATSYVWQAPSGWTVIGASNTNTITFKASSAFGFITVRAVNQCGQSPQRLFNVTVLAPPPSSIGAIQGSNSACSNSAQAYSVAQGNYTFNWASTGSTITGNGTNSITASWATSGSKQLSVSASNQCGTSNASTLFITVNTGTPPAQPSTISGSTTVCKNVAGNYSVTNVSGVTYQWQVSGNTGTITGSGNSVSITFTQAGTHTISCTPVGACGTGPARTLDVLVREIPAMPDTIFGLKTVCPGQSVTYSIAAVSGATSYTWLGPNTNGWSFNSSSTTTYSGTAGTTAATIQVSTSNTCGSSSPKTLSVTQGNPPVQPQTISGPSSFCTGDTVTFSVAHPINGTVSSYNWTLGGATILANPMPGNSITVFYAGNTATQISVTAQNACGVSTARTKSITINTPPTQPGSITGPNAVCSGTSNTYSIAAVSGATSYVWTLPTLWVGNSTTTSISATAITSSGNVSVRASNQCGTGPVRNLAVTVNNAPAQPGAIQGDTSVCPAQSKTYSVASVTGATSYLWQLLSGWSGTSSTNSINATTGQNGGIISVIASNSCGNSSPRLRNINMGSSPQGIDTILGAVVVCEGVAQSYTVAAQNDVTYSWAGGPGSTLTGGNTNNPTIVWTSSGVKNVVATISSSCGTVSKTIQVNVSSGTPPAQPTGFSGDTITCLKIVTYSVTQEPGITYQWSISGGGALQNNGNTASVNWLNTGNHSITCIPVGQCGAGTALVKNISVDMPFTAISNSNLTYSVPLQNGATYQWFDCTTQQPIAGATSNEYTFTSSGNVFVKVSRLGCEESSACVEVTLTGIEVNAKPLALQVYPNPATDKIMVEVNEAVVLDIVITDITGRNVVFQRMENEVLGLNISGLAEGMYMLRAFDENKRLIAQKKFLKQ